MTKYLIIPLLWAFLTVGMAHNLISVETSTLESGASVTAYAFDGVTIHAYTGGPISNSTYIIESPNSLVLVDAQFFAPPAQEFRAYADDLGKSIERLIITHEHPDHWFGLGAAFKDVNVYTTEGTKAFLDANGEGMLASQAESMGADNVYVPVENTLPEGGEEIDGVQYQYMVYEDAEADEQVVILLPDQETMLTGDLIYHGMHLIMRPDFGTWIGILETLKDKDGYSLALPGHGLPADMSVLDANLDYLRTARVAYAMAEGPEEFKDILTTIYPDREGGDLFWSITSGYLYPSDTEESAE